MKLIQLQITLILILTLAGGIVGQSTKKIFGHIFDAKTNHPLVGATILIDGSSIGTSSNGAGYFQFDNLLVGYYSLTVSYIGYKSKAISNVLVKIDQPTRINFYLEIAPHKIDDVVVLSYSEDQALSNVTILKVDEIKSSIVNSVGELLEQVPGVEVLSTGGVGSSQKISIRGSEANQVLVMLDGIPLNNQFGGSADLSNIPINIIESIEVYEGGSSYKFGSGAIGGAINIKTKRNFKNEYRVNITGGSFGYFNIEPSISGNYKNLGYYLSYNNKQSEGNYPYSYTNVSGVAEKDVRVNAHLNSQNIFTRINYSFDNFSFSINGQILDSERGLPGKTNALTAYMKSENRTNIFGANFKAVFDKIIFDINSNFSNSETENSNLYPDDAPIKYKRYPRYHYKYESDITVLNSTLHYNPIEWLHIKAGYNGKWLLYKDENFRRTIKSSINNALDVSHGLFLHQDYKVELPKPLNHISISPAIRYDVMNMSSGDLDRAEEQWSPAFSVFFSMGEKHNIFLKSSISRSFRVPTFSDLFYQDVRIEGKPDLLPEKSLNKEIGIGCVINIWGKIRGEISFYNYSIKDMIVWKLGSFEVFRPFNNDAEITGQNYSIEYETPNNYLKLKINYTALQALDKNNYITTHNKIIPYKPQHSLKSSIQFNWKDFSGIVRYRMVGKRFVTVANTVELPPYNVLDLSITQKINIDRLKTIFRISINNLTDETYEIVRNYPIPGREFRLGITLTY